MICTEIRHCLHCGRTMTSGPRAVTAGDLAELFTDDSAWYCSKRCARAHEKAERESEYQHRNHMSIFDVEGV